MISGPFGTFHSRSKLPAYHHTTAFESSRLFTCLRADPARIATTPKNKKTANSCGFARNTSHRRIAHSSSSMTGIARREASGISHRVSSTHDTDLHIASHASSTSLRALNTSSSTRSTIIIIASSDAVSIIITARDRVRTISDDRESVTIIGNARRERSEERKPPRSRPNRDSRGNRCSGGSESPFAFDVVTFLPQRDRA
jgi:hypothetical protein